MKTIIMNIVTPLILCVFCTAISAHALLYEFNSVILDGFSGSKNTWLTAEFTDTTQLIGVDKTSKGVLTYGVLLKLRAPNITTFPGDVFVSDWYFNTKLENTINDLKFISVLNGTTIPTLSVEANGHNAGTGTKFDINFKFPTKNKSRFEQGDSADIFMYGVAGLTADSFNSLSNGKQSFAEAHIQGISSNLNSVWVVPISDRSTPAPVPEPGSFILFGIGLLGLAVYAKRRMNRQ